MMARVPCNRLVLLAFLLLCFISLSDAARRLGVTSAPPAIVGAAKSKGQVLQDDQHHVGIPAKENGDQVPNVDEELVTVDYTPARKKPPIHN